MNEISCYIHVPFCKSRCPYCDFYALRGGNLELMQNYVARCCGLLAQDEYCWKTLYIGGGTPSVLPPALLTELLAAARRNLLPGAEFTIECNPSSVTADFCAVCAAGGVNRASLGVQSIVPQERRALGRAGNIDTILQALRCLRAAGISNISLDFMLGVPRQTPESLAETLQFCVSAGASHVSAYLLKIEEGTRFAQHPPEGLPDEDAQAEFYLTCCEWLAQHGYEQYEISNFCLSGYESRHNLAYWRCEEYFAIGPAAHGYTGGRRWHYDNDLAAFLAGAAPMDDGPGGDDERAMLALRLAEGVLSPTAQMKERAATLSGLVICDERGLRLTRQGFLLSNAVIGKLLYP